LGEIHEFEADRDVLDGGSTVEEYLPIIFRQIFGCVPELTVGLGDSLTKKRFLMMKNKMKLTRFSRLRVAGVLPLAAGMMLLFSFTTRQPEIIEPVAPASAPQSAVQNPDWDTPLQMAEVMPSFEGGGIQTFHSWVLEKMVYPKEAHDNKIEGMVLVKFVVERDGSISNIGQIESPHELLYNEVVRVLGESPRWTPGMQDGKPVRVFFVMPVKFSLLNPASDK
jgi:TonB family protein